ncbi:hypothetical protein B0T20DRAFT_450398 [Sordaria brevicollis]|uniref:Uncharacterized protein n=1 Tax=Sordaria brevicollis TaxID=83679 RepID=A0AAE0PP65_SORBR|nr:hypothetical protein B0T20DRAFT_450398 [Sordaria brevicollis]
MLPPLRQNNRVSSKEKVSSWILEQQHLAQSGVITNVDAPPSVRMSPAISTTSRSNIIQTPPKDHNINPLPPLRPSKRKTSYGGNQDQDPENDDSTDHSLRRSFASLLELRPAKRARNNPAPPPPPPPSQRRLANRTRTNTQATRSSRQVLRAPAEEENDATATAAPAEAAGLVQDKKDTFPFLELPLEIREKILNHFLVSDKPVYVKRLWTEQVRPTRRSTRGRGHCGKGEGIGEQTIETAILRTCRQMLVEGSNVLYSQNQFVYLLRDPLHAEVDFASMLADVQKEAPEETAGRGRRKRKADSQPSGGSYGLHQINVAKYGHLLRHLSIELEPNRSGKEYRELMEKALDVLASLDKRGRYLLAGQAVDEKTSRIFLNTLTITVSPENDKDQRPRRNPRSSAGSNQETSAPYSSAIELFGSKSGVMHALSRIDTNFLRINMHIDQDAQAEEEDEFAVNDHLMKEQRLKRGEEAEAALQFLRERMYEGFTNPDEAILSGLWEDNSAAVMRRKKERAEFEARLEGVDQPTKNVRRQSDDEEEESSSEEEDDDDDDDDYDSRPKKKSQRARARGRGRYGCSLLFSVRRGTDGLIACSS